MFVDPKNDVTGRDGYDQITGYTHKGDKQITFKWKKPYAAWQLLFSGVYPRGCARRGWTSTRSGPNCICGNDGKPVSDGPFLLTNYTKGQGSTLKKNPLCYGAKAKLNEIDFKLITDTNTEVQAMRGGEVDAINPTFGLNLLPLKSTPGVTFNTGAGSLPGAHRHPVRQAGAAAPARSVDAQGAHDGHRSPGDHQDGVRRSRAATRRR